MPAPLNVLYEASWLGMAHGDPAAMRGIYRVVTEIIRYTQNVPEMDISACAEANPLADAWGREAVAALGLLPAGHWVSAWRHLLPARWLRREAAGPRRALRKLAAMASWQRRQPQTWDIAHSLFYPWRDDSPYRARARFLMIYDLLPLKFPEFFGGSAEFMRASHTQLINSLRPEQDWATCISECTKRDLGEFTRLAPERIFVTPLAAGPEFYRCTDPLIIKNVQKKYRLPDAPYFLSLCTLDPRKNLGRLLRCFVRVLEETRDADWQLVLAGAARPDFAALWRETSQSPALRARVLCPGYIAEEDLAPFYSGARAFVFPSLYEGFGLPVLEAMQCGLPVISSNASSLPEVAGDAGLLVAPTDADALSQAMLRLMRDTALRDELAARSLAQARRFSWEKTAAALASAYRAALDQG